MIGKTKLALVLGLALAGLMLYTAVSTVFIIGLLGLLIIPPVLAFAIILFEGRQIIADRLNSLSDPEKKKFVIYTAQ